MMGMSPRSVYLAASSINRQEQMFIQEIMGGLYENLDGAEGVFELEITGPLQSHAPIYILSIDFEPELSQQQPQQQPQQPQQSQQYQGGMGRGGGGGRRGRGGGGGGRGSRGGGGGGFKRGGGRGGGNNNRNY
jgi:hypothetical protein